MKISSTSLNLVIQEMKVWSKEWGIAGTLDGLFELSNKYYVGDYKTNKDLLTTITQREEEKEC